jgi:hypothetical protein
MISDRTAFWNQHSTLSEERDARESSIPARRMRVLIVASSLLSHVQAAVGAAIRLAAANPGTGAGMSSQTKDSIGEKWNQKYCDRLVQLAFPAEAKVADTVDLRDHRYSRETLLIELRINADLAEWLKARICHHPEPANAEELADVVFLPRVTVGAMEYTKAALTAKLPQNPKLQQRVAVLVHYVPSKWLLEQERAACKKWSADRGDIYKTVAKEGLIGVCFSGGGIRSATFNLGILQGLAQVGLLPCIDYLSSVSGGGYIHEFLAAWILRNERGRQGVIDELIPQAEPGCLPRAPEPIKWLMRYASYLTPQRGPFSTDTWTMLAVWFRNTVLNQIPILAGLLCGLFAFHLLLWTPLIYPGDFWKWSGTAATVLWSIAGLFGAVVAIFAFVSLGRLSRNLQHQQNMHKLGSASATMVAKPLLTNKQVQLHLILPWLAAAVWLSYWAQLRLSPHCPVFWFGLAPFCLWILATVMVVIFSGGAMDSYKRLHGQPTSGQRVWARVGFIAIGLLTTAIACALGWGFVWASAWLADHVAALVGPIGAVKQSAEQTLNFSVNGTAQGYSATLAGSLAKQASSAGRLLVDPWRIQLALLPGLLLSVPYVAIELTLGLLGRDYSDIRREWLARLRAWSLLYALLWGALVSLALLGPYVMFWLVLDKFGGVALTSKGIWSAIVSAVSVVTSVLTGASSKADGKPADKGIFGIKPMDLLALAAAPLTVLSFLLLLSFGAYGASWALDLLAPAHWSRGWRGMIAYGLANVVCLFAAFLVALLFGWRVDINEFSMLSFYRNRLSRCYLGATVPERQADPFTGFDGRSELMLANGKTQKARPTVRDLLPAKYTAVKKEDNEKDVEGNYEGPFPIFCTTLNLTTGDDLATQERKGTSFAFTPLYSGYSVSWTDGHKECNVSYNGYVPTEHYAYSEQGVALDTAVAISGAAVNPNMGYNSNPALAFLMTFFNVRLGWWISNPRKKDQWPAGEKRPTPLFAALYLFRELIGKVNDAAPYVNLSDGGHFENMGLYELVRRRCRYIVVCDAEEDPRMTFEGMGAAITKCRADFGADIDLDLRPLQIQAETGYSKAHCVVGTIQYPPPPGEMSKPDRRTTCRCLGETDSDLYTGVIVYIKSSLVGDEPPDLLTYQLKHAVFPQDSTADQWFQETQFEAYRRLGHHVAMATFPSALSPAATSVQSKDDIPQLFRSLYQIWYPRTPEMEKYLGDHLKQYEAILKELRERKELVGLEARLNDPTPWSVTDVVTWKVPEGDALAALYPQQFANSLIDFMYTIYTDLQLAFPDNRVSPHAEWWICLFRRWCRVTLLQDAWKAHEVGYPLEFQLFAQRELNLPEVEGTGE